MRKCLAEGGAGGGMGGRMGRRGGSESGGRPETNAARPAAQPDAAELAQMRLDTMFDALNPDSTLLPIWKNYAAKVLLVIDDQRRWKQRATDSKPERVGPAPKAMEQQMDEVRDRLTALEDITTAAKTLYEKLDMRQRAVADQHMAMIIGILARNDSATMMAGPVPPKKVETKQ